MKTEISTDKFKNMLKVMDKIKSRELNLSTDLLVKAIDDKTQFIKTNGETTIIYSIPSYIKENGQVTIPLETAEIIKKLKENCLRIEEDKITTDRKTININKLDDIKINTYENIDIAFSTTQKELLRMLEVSYTMAQDGTRPILCGVYFNKNETCALDGYRMSVRVSEEYKNDTSFVVNKNGIEILQSILKDNDNIVNISVNQEIVKFELDNIIIITDVLQGDFIKYQSIIPNDYDITAIVKPEEYLEELDFIKVADKRNTLKTVFTEDNKILLKGSQCKEQYNEELSLKDMEKRQKELNAEYKIKHDKWIKNGRKHKEPVNKEAKFKKIYDFVPVSNITSEINSKNILKGGNVEKGTFTIAYNPIYMSDAMKQYEDTVELRMMSRVTPIVITNDGKNLELVLPVRMSD